MDFFKITISLGELVGVLLTLALALNANELRLKGCVTKIKHLTHLLV